ncbi:asparagine synthase (glutamine-hydrolysing) [Plasticicumulans lactativorans]|uniref:asparagine synthase (glutamine-hydrolyzing) n=1 Tax=Plasticicumulans lactativorans TaxID=1133106 RepID=A0A4V2SCR1_9GAMM|nr:asparagine synthase (glutamine-hydrolyzing) [Plasticicumulans lactativorans]TCO80340.1 asparagine synthase (glutamine-hydrolysing) [Plasticicumulans lactativorans]
MCGIAGYAGVDAEFDMRAALAAMRHRGPDAQNEWRSAGLRCPVGLGHVRLSILDLTEAANQPFVSSDGRYVIVFNGEIYNHEYLREQLSANGAAFRTRSDTEVLLEAFRKWGEACLPMLDGMFAFAILDCVEQFLFMARDPFGIKPLYFSVDAANGTLAFASEIRALVALARLTKEPDTDSLAEFLMNGWLYEPATGIRNVQKLAPGECARFSLATKQMTVHRYYDPLILDVQERRREIDELLLESMRLQCLADVPVGLFFSGGLDSSVLAAMAPTGLEALFVDYGIHAGSGDVGYAEAIAGRFGMPMSVVTHTPEVLGADAILAGFEAVAHGTEEPISDYTYLASEEIAHVARRRGFKVMLSGMGGDELFAGYPRHRLVRFSATTRAISPFLKLAAPLLRRQKHFAKKTDRLIGFAEDADFTAAYTRLIGYFSPLEVGRLLGKHDAIAQYQARVEELLQPAVHLSPLKQALYLDRYGFLAHNLTVTDRSSMAHSIEVRVPLITTKLAAAAMALPDAALLSLSQTKRPLRQLLRKRLPKSLVDRPKVGFNPPLDSKIAMLGAALIGETLRTGPLRDHVDLDLCDELITRHFSGQSNESYKLWQLLYLGFWLGAHKAAGVEAEGAYA